MSKETLTRDHSIAPATLFEVADTDLNRRIDIVQMFITRHFGLTIDVRKRFVIPAKIPWRSVLPIVDLGYTTNRSIITLLEKLGHNVWEETDVMNYTGSEPTDTPTLHLIESSIYPSTDTMGMSPDDLHQTRRNYLSLRGYCIAFAVHYLITTKNLDSNETLTLFPEDRLFDAGVASSSWLPGLRQIGFRWFSPDSHHSNGGARVAIPVPLNPNFLLP